MGNSVSLRLPAKGHIELDNNDIRGVGDCLIDMECAEQGCRSAIGDVHDNRLTGAVRADAAVSRLPCAVWVESPLRGADLRFRGNSLDTLRSADCPDGMDHCEDNKRVLSKPLTA